MKIFTLKLKSTNKAITKELYGTAEEILDTFISNDWIDFEGFRDVNEVDLLGYYDEDSNYVKGYLETHTLTDEDIIEIIDSFGDWYYKEWIEEE